MELEMRVWKEMLLVTMKLMLVWVWQAILMVCVAVVKVWAVAVTMEWMVEMWVNTLAATVKKMVIGAWGRGISEELMVAGVEFQEVVVKEEGTLVVVVILAGVEMVEVMVAEVENMALEVSNLYEMDSTSQSSNRGPSAAHLMSALPAAL